MSILNTNNSFNLNKRSFEQESLESPISFQGEQARKKAKIKEDVSSLKSQISKLRGDIASIKTPNLIDLYSLGHLSPHLDTTLHRFALQDALALVQDWYTLHPEFTRWIQVINKVKEIRDSSLSFEEKMAELGLVYFYLDRDGNMPQESSLLCYRSSEIMQEIDILKKEQLRCCNEKNAELPSGFSHYLLRAFSHMLVSSEHRFNQGCAYAILLLLEKADLQVSVHLEDEHRRHILFIIQMIAEKPQFKLVLEKEIKIHKDLEPLIRFDLKLPKDVPLSPHLIMQACLMALFFDIRQDAFAPNCYAIATLIYAKENAPFKVLMQLTEWLEKGHFVFETKTYPISDLMECRLERDNDLVSPIQPQRAGQLPSFKKIERTLSYKKHLTKKQNSSFYNALTDLLQKNHAESDLAYVKNLFISFKHNSLIDMMLTILEHQNELAHSIKKELVETIDQLFLRECSKDLDDFELLLLQLITNEISDSLSLLHHYEPYPVIKDGKLTFGPFHQRQAIENFSGDLTELSKLLKGCYFPVVITPDRTKAIVIQSLQFFQKVIEQMVHASYLNLSDGGLEAEKVMQNLTHLFSTELFLTTLADFLAKKIDNKGITARSIYESDLFLLNQIGGKNNFLLNAFQIGYSIKCLQVASPVKLLLGLSNFFSKIDKSITSQTETYLTTANDHTFLLTHYSFKDLYNGNPVDFLQTTSIDPANSFYDQEIDLTTKSTVLKRLYKKNRSAKKKTLLYLDKYDHLTNKKFRRVLLKSIKPEKKAELEKIIDEEFWSIELSKEAIYTLIHSLGYKIDVSLAETIQKELVQEIPRRASPFVFAKKLHKILISHQIGVASSLEIEKAICRHAGLPLPLQIGDLNWTPHHKEDPSHSTLIIRLYFGTNQMNLFIREDDTEKLEKFENYKDFYIQYPKI